MREPILKAVASPPQLLWAPFLPAVANFGIQLPFMFIALGVFEMSPLWFIPSMVGMHIILVVYGMKEPHLSTLLESYGKFAGGSHNMYKSKGTKLAP
ncbi:MAG: hypothetical protein IKD08_03265 [Alphaproteobacteria bacterium]|nr:hypothetical protein [Alphaproteobacteria bacterium]